MNLRLVLALCAALSCATAAHAADETHDLTFFLHQLRSLDDLPLIDQSHTAMSSTWDRTGGNGDGSDFKRIEGNRNILLDVDGPGCIHRIFTGVVDDTLKDTRIRIFLDNATTPTFEMGVRDFFDPEKGPLPYPLVFHKTYPGTLFPIPFAKHCRVELDDPQAKNWGNYWQVTYTIYPATTKIQTLRWPLDDREKAELKKVCDTLLSAEKDEPPAPDSWTVDRKLSIAPGKSAGFDVEGCSVIRQMRIAADPGTPEALVGVRMSITWDNAKAPSVDVPLGYFFGNGDFGSADSKAWFNSLLMGANAHEAWSLFPMPFAHRGHFEFANTGAKPVALEVKLDVQKLTELPAHCGRFHATWLQEYVQSPYDQKMRKFGPQNVPSHVSLEQNDGPGKFVGTFLFVHWPNPDWWGEGDWQIWSDEDGWPPSYHGTGSEEYFNSGWCAFDRKAISGFVRYDLPGNVAVYSFHLNDSFSFQKNIRVSVEISPWHPPKSPAIWGTTSYWYALAPSATGSRSDVLPTQGF